LTNQYRRPDLCSRAPPEPADDDPGVINSFNDPVRRPRVPAPYLKTRHRNVDRFESKDREPREIERRHLSSIVGESGIARRQQKSAEEPSGTAQRTDDRRCPSGKAAGCTPLSFSAIAALDNAMRATAMITATSRPIRTSCAGIWAAVSEAVVTATRTVTALASASAGRV
jgi:hypothetical protein